MYRRKELYTLDFSKVRYFIEVHDVLAEELDFPDYYGKSLDALWDCLTDMVSGGLIHIEILGFEHVRKLFGERMDSMLEVFKDLKHWCNDHFADQIKIELVYGNSRYEIE